MANYFSLYAILLLLAISSTLMVMVASDRCKENMGGCSNECNKKCGNAHKGGVGNCEASGGVGGQKGCWCHYDCPELEKCSENFKLEKGCSNQLCDSSCASRHPGHGAVGVCGYDYSQQQFLCGCTYYCNPPSSTN